MLRQLALILVVTALIAACGQIQNDRLPADVYEFKLPDGTRCVALYRGGITCEWKRQ